MANGRFFAGPPAFTVEYPAFHTSPGEVVHYTRDATLTIAGSSPDPRVEFSVPGHNVGVSRDGRFHFSGIPLPARGDNVVRLRAEAPAGVTHEAELVVRRAAPRKHVTLPSALFSPELAHSADNLPFVTVGVNQPGRFEHEEGLIGLLSEWQSSWQRPGYYLYRFDPAAPGWPWTRLLPDAWFENEAAGLLIEDMNRVFGAGGFRIPAAQPSADGLHNLRQLTLHVTGGGVPEHIAYAREHVDRVAAPFATGSLPLSANAPLLPLGQERVATAFVAGTAAGLALSRSSSLQDVLSSQHATMFHDRGADGPHVGVGTLFYCELDAAGVRRHREAVAHDVWCHRVIMRRDPATERPVILALGAMPDDERGAPRSSLRLFTRAADGRWEEQEAWGGRPIVDADFTFGPQGELRVVARVYDERDIHRQLYELRRENGAFSARTVVYSHRIVRETGIGRAPRIVVDAQGRSLIAILGNVLVPAWLLLAERGEGWEAVLVNGIETANLPDQQDFDLTQEGRLRHYGLAPALALADDGAALLAHTDATLQLMRVDVDSLAVSGGAFDVDRLTGVAPAIEITPRGTVGVAYKDAWGEGETGDGAAQQLHYFNTGDGVPVPPLAALPPEIRSESFDLRAFAPHVPLGPDQLTSFDTAGDPELQDRLVRSVLLERRFNLRVFPGGHTFEDDSPPLAIRRSHPEIHDLILGLDPQPQVTQLTVDNSAFQEPVLTLSVTTFGPLLRADAAIATSLAAGVVPDELNDALVAAGLPTRRSLSYDVSRVPGRDDEWDVLVPDPFGVQIIVSPIPAPPGTTTFARSEATVRYHCRLVEGALEVSLRPLLTVVDRAATTDADGRFAPLGVSQWTYDTFGQSVSQRFEGIGLGALPAEIQRADWFFLGGVRVSDVSAADPANEQNGAIRFRLTIPTLLASGREGASFTLRSTEPTHYDVDFAPFVRGDGRLDWHVRRVLATPGDIDVDLNVFSGDPLLTFLAIELFPFSFIAQDVVADIVQEQVNEGFRDADPGSLPALLLASFMGFVDEQITRRELDVSAELGFPPTVSDEQPLPPLEAVRLRDRALQYWVRGTAAPQPDVRLAPEELNLGITPLDGPGVERGLLITNVGDAPALVTRIDVGPGPDEFAIVAPTLLPQAVAPGDALAFRVRFRPIGSVGPRERGLTVRLAGGLDAVRGRLIGFASEALRPDLRLIAPSLTTFGLVENGRTVTRAVELRNEGDAALEVLALELQADLGSVRPFRLGRLAPLSVAPGGSETVAITFAPDSPAPQQHRARLVITSNDPDQPRVEAAMHAISAGPPSGGSALRLRASEHELDFGRVQARPGSFGVRHVNLFNEGATTLTIPRGDLEVASTQGALVSLQYDVTGVQGAALPNGDLTLAPSTGIDLLVFFRPLTVGAHPGALVLTAREVAGERLEIAVRGEGVT